MNKQTWLSPMLVLAALAAAAVVKPEALVSTAQAAETTPACAADPAWINSPSLPTEIPGGGTDFCQFYQYAWQTFLYLVSPSAGDSGIRNFEVQQDYPTLLASGKDSCTGTAAGPQLFVRMLKDGDADGDFVIPERIGQAGGGDTIYDQSGNVVFYDVRFDRGLCSAPMTGDLPAGTTELKSSWRVLDSSDSGYFTMQAIIEGVSEQPITLGMVGFHLFRTTSQHPEGVWMTWEHGSNAPDCLQPQPTPASGWSFTSSQCAQCLAGSSTGPLACSSCGFNTAKPSSSLTGTPSEICRVYRDGTGPNDNKAAENLADVDSLNQQLVGPNGLLAKADPELNMGVWQNYFNVGGLWVSDPSQPADSANQRGSLQLTNSTMETTFQGTFKATGSGVVRGGAVNCFGCHQYTPGQTATSGLSHIFDDIHGSSSGDAATKSGAHVLHYVGSGRPGLGAATGGLQDSP